MNVNYEYYRTFYYVARYGNFTKAANVLCASQPNVTRSIANLEKQLGCTLFVRSNRGVVLTPEGERLFGHIQIAQEQIQQAEQELEGNVGLQTGVIPIACSETALNLFLLDKLRIFHERYPGIRLRISNDSTPQAIAALEHGTADLAIVTSPVQIKRPFESVELMEFQEVLVAGAEFKTLQKNIVSIKDLKQYPIVMLRRDTVTYNYYNELFSKAGELLCPDTEVATSEQLLPVIKAGLGIGFVPEGMAKEAMKKGEVYRLYLKEELPVRNVVQIRDTRRTLSVAAKTLLQLLK